MPQYRTIVEADGIITLPAPLRKKLKISQGCQVEFYVSLEGDVFFHAITGKAKDWGGLYETEVRSPPISIREMDQAVGDALVEDDRRIRKQGSPRRPRHRRTAAE
jgi:bifunctional DNA-binding transcriptional regulator/antitoxin component of YhaV-PrlF toxin-antitoxin module